MNKSRYLLTGILLAAILMAGILILKKNNPASRGPVATQTQDGKAKGTANAPVQLVEYSDFQCPACAYAEPVIAQILNDPAFAGKIRFIYRHFPITGHHRAALAHQAAECANSFGKFWEYHEKLYSHQNDWVGAVDPTEVILQYSKDIDLPMDQFALCLVNPEIHAKVMAEKKNGEYLQIRSTPTFFINGDRIVGTMELQNRGVEMIRKILGVPAPALSPSPEISPSASPAPTVSPS